MPLIKLKSLPTQTNAMLDHVRREHDRQDDALAKADVERENVLVHFGPTSV